MAAQRRIDLVLDSVKRLLRIGATGNLLNLLQKQHPADLAQIFSDLQDKEREAAFSLLAERNGRLAMEAKALQALGIGVAGINANDAASYPEDSFENMKAFAAEHGIAFPYLVDPSQQTARAYGAVCTPDFFGYNADLELQYRGRLDASKTTPIPGAIRELYEAMAQIAETGRGPEQQIPSMGCSIKWKAA